MGAMSPAEVRAYIEAHGFALVVDDAGRKVVVCSACRRQAVYVAQGGRVNGISCPGKPPCRRARGKVN